MTSLDASTWVTFCMVRGRRRRGLFRVQPPEYEVSVGGGAPTRVPLDRLPDELGVSPGASNRDWQECEMVASSLFRSGSLDKWVDYPTGQVLDDAAGTTGDGS